MPVKPPDSRIKGADSMIVDCAEHGSFISFSRKALRSPLAKHLRWLDAIFFSPRVVENRNYLGSQSSIFVKLQ